MEDRARRSPQRGLASVHLSPDSHGPRSGKSVSASGSSPADSIETIERGVCGRGRFADVFGPLVHSMSATVDLDADADTVQASAAINGRLPAQTTQVSRPPS